MGVQEGRRARKKTVSQKQHWVEPRLEETQSSIAEGDEKAPTKPKEEGSPTTGLTENHAGDAGDVVSYWC